MVGDDRHNKNGTLDQAILNIKCYECLNLCP